MNFSSPLFLFLFLPVLLLLYVFLLRPQARNGFLLVASLFFYCWGEGRFALVLLLSIVGNYLLGLWLGQSQKRGSGRLLFWIAVSFNLLLLGFFKYSHFAAGQFRFPLGISFFTFQALTYIIEAYRRTIPVQRNPLPLALYLANFSVISAGPIVRFRSFFNQLHREITLDDLTPGVRRFVIGLGKKVLLANPLATIVDPIFTLKQADLSLPLAWLGIVAYMLQIYLDFSGYTDMAVGLGRMLGFTFPENFHYPYLARSITDFWQRWHKSLSTWLRDYLFLPLAYALSRRIKRERLWGRRSEDWIYLISVLLTMTACGFWHGAAWTFVVWGVMQGIFMGVEHLGWRRFLRRRSAVFSHLYALLAIGTGLVFFRADNLGSAVGYLRTLFGFGLTAHGPNGPIAYPGLYLDPFRIFIIMAALAAVTPFPAALFSRWRPVAGSTIALRQRQWLRWSYALGYNLFLAAVVLLCAMSLAQGTANPFIYFQF